MVTHNELGQTSIKRIKRSRIRWATYAIRMGRIRKVYILIKNVKGRENSDNKVADERIILIGIFSNRCVWRCTGLK
jgi:hypothetical protein